MNGQRFKTKKTTRPATLLSSFSILPHLPGTRQSFSFFFSRGTATEIPRTTYPARPVAASVVPAGTLLGENCTVRVHFATAAFSLGSRAHPRDAVGLEGCQLFLAELNLLIELARVHEQLGFDADKAIVVCTFVGSQITAQQ